MTLPKLKGLMRIHQKYLIDGNGGIIMMDDRKEPLVSVIMNCFNGEKYLKEAIDSVYAQTYKNWEIIFWDNASTDRSAEIALSYDNRLRYFRGDETIPLGAARKKALEQSSGELIAFLDCDDVWLPEKLEKQVETMFDCKYALCYAGIINIDQFGNKIGTYIPKYRSGNLFPQLLKQFDINIPTAMIRKSVLLESKLSFDENIFASEEYCLFMQLAVSYEFHIIPFPLAKYRIHENALSNKSIKNWADEREYTLNLIQKNNPGIRRKYSTGFREAYARARYYRARFYALNGKKANAMRELSKNIFIDARYLALLFLLLMPLPLWNKTHNIHSKRKIFNIIE